MSKEKLVTAFENIFESTLEIQARSNSTGVERLDKFSTIYIGLPGEADKMSALIEVSNKIFVRPIFFFPNDSWKSRIMKAYFPIKGILESRALPSGVTDIDAIFIDSPDDMNKFFLEKIRQFALEQMADGRPFLWVWIR